jgi:Mrp family chromosome partitioning ATPase
MLLDTENQPVIWRGPMVANILKQFYQEVFWDDVDYMFIDMPPGTGDIPLTLFQSIPLDGIIVVTSPQELVGMVVEKAINMANMMNIKVLGLIENMSYVKCPCCDEQIMVFGHSHIQETADRFGLPVLARVPLDPRIAGASDAGTIEDLEIEEIKPAVDFIESL